MISDYISVGNKLELQKVRTSENSLLENQIYLSKLLDFVGTDKANITMPIVKGRIIPLDVGDKYILCFYTNKGLFQCKAVITARSKMSNIYTLEVQFLSQLEKYQRRQFYRFNCNIDMTYHVISEAEEIVMELLQQDNFQNEIEKDQCILMFDEYRKDWNKGTITDISGGGARFVTGSELKEGDKLQITFDLNVNDSIKHNLFQVKVVSSTVMVTHPGSYEHRIQYLDISKESQEEIIRYIFEEERRLRKKVNGYN